MYTHTQARPGQAKTKIDEEKSKQNEKKGDTIYIDMYKYMNRHCVYKTVTTTRSKYLTNCNKSVQSDIV